MLPDVAEDFSANVLFFGILAAQNSLRGGENGQSQSVFHLRNILASAVKSARRFAYNSINLAQLRQNWLIGQKIVIQEQNGNDRAEYGKHIVEIASKELTAEFGKGFSERAQCIVLFE